MTYLAYDPARVAALRDSMRRAVDELLFLVSGDVEAVDAMRLVRSARQRLSDSWLPLAERVLTDPVLTDWPTFTFAGVTELQRAEASVLRDRFGWVVTSDPLGAAVGLPTSAEVELLAQTLEEGDLSDLLDSKWSLQWLCAQLTAIAADPALTAAFLAHFDRLDELCEVLATDRVQRVVDDQPAEPGSHTAAIDDVFRAIAPLAGGAAPAALEGMSPYAAALLVRFLGLDAQTLATTADQLLVRWSDGAAADGWEDLSRPGPNTADILFQTLLDTPSAPARYVVLAAAHPETMWWSAEDAGLVQRLALLGTDPRWLSVEDAGAVIPTFIDYFELCEPSAQESTHRAAPAASRSLLGTLVAPWLRQFSPMNAQWSHDDAEAKAMADRLAFVIEDDGALDALIDAQHTAVERLTSSAKADPAAVEDLAGVVGLLGALLVRERDRDAAQRRAEWDMIWTIGAIPLNIALPNVVSVPVDLLIDAVQDYAGAHALLGSPDLAGVHDRAVYEMRWMRTVGAAAMVSVGVIAMVADGRLPAGVEAPPEPDPTSEHPEASYARAYDAWKRRVFGVGRSAESDVLDALKSPFVNAADASASLVD